LIVYLDTSVLVAYYTVEDRTSDAAAIIERAELPVISDICIAELNVVILRKQREGFLSEQAADSVLALFDEHLRDSFQVLS
jgi:predicted nucleic acid-binding protein